MTRQIVLDTETTGLSAEGGDRIIEIGCVELVGRKLTGSNKAAAQKSANVLQDAAHDYFSVMRTMQAKVKITDPALCDALGLPYDGHNQKLYAFAVPQP